VYWNSNLYLNMGYAPFSEALSPVRLPSCSLSLFSVVISEHGFSMDYNILWGPRQGGRKNPFLIAARSLDEQP
jgi:hypothetical protein